MSFQKGDGLVKSSPTKNISWDGLRLRGVGVCGLFSRETRKVAAILEKLQLKPKPLPSITLNIVRPEDFEALADEPLTIYDRILLVEDISTLSLDFNLIVEELGKVSRRFRTFFVWGKWFHLKRLEL